MYERIEVTRSCEKCRSETDERELAKWRAAHSDLAETWLGSSHENAQKLKDAGYYQWTYPEQEILIIEADCHGDALHLCKKHFEDWFHGLMSRFSVSSSTGTS